MTAQKIKEKFDALIPAPKCELNYKSPYQLLVAVILSAQCTDKRVNMVTKEMFKKYDTPEKVASLAQEELEEIIHSCGFYHNKAKNILAMTKDVLEKYNGQVPSTMEELVSLAGVGRKTANVVIGEAFGGEAIAVDTHVLRVSNRLALAKTSDPFKCEQALMKFFPSKYWSEIHLQMVLFGRYYCKSQKPLCKGCPFFDICTYEDKNKML